LSYEKAKTVMGFSITWDNAEQTILRVTYDGHWDLEDFRSSNSQAYEMIKSVARPVNVILDMRLSSGMPSGFSSAIRDVNRGMPLNTGQIILVQKSLLVEIMVNAMSKLVRGQRRPFTMVHTLDEARQLAASPREPDEL
jgi:hypothetical protein